MSFFRVLWDDPQDPYGNVQHVMEHGLDIEDVEEVLSNPCKEGTSRSKRAATRLGLLARRGVHPRGL